MPFLSPLRYPGGKRKLTNFFKLIFHYNDLLDGEYVELYAGGASLGLSLLYDEYARQIHINDLDRGVYAFWYSALNTPEELSRLIRDTPVTMEEWYHQKQIQNDHTISQLELGFSTFFLNRTNRSGIVSGGVIGGKKQAGTWKLDARYNKEDLIMRISKVARYKNRIHLYGLDASSFIRDILPKLDSRSLIYLDPPYYVKGRQLLYANYYQPQDHKYIAQLVGSIRQKWVVSYDDVPEIRELYKNFRSLDYGIHYSAQERYQGSEIMFFCQDLALPEVGNPSRVRSRMLQNYLI